MSKARSSHIASLRIGRHAQHTGTSNQNPYRTTLLSGVCYPEGNFGVNQLLDTSMGLSPLDPTRANDLHVNTVNGPPPGFLPASTSSGIVQHLSGPSSCASADGSRRRCCRAAEATHDTKPGEPLAPLSLRPMVSVTIKLAHVLDSLVRVSRRVAKPHSEQRPNWLQSRLGTREGRELNT